VCACVCVRVCVRVCVHVCVRASVCVRVFWYSLLLASSVSGMEQRSKVASSSRATVLQEPTSFAPTESTDMSSRIR